MLLYVSFIHVSYVYMYVNVVFTCNDVEICLHINIFVCTANYIFLQMIIILLSLWL